MIELPASAITRAADAYAEHLSIHAALAAAHPEIVRAVRDHDRQLAAEASTTHGIQLRPGRNALRTIYAHEHGDPSGHLVGMLDTPALTTRVCAAVNREPLLRDKLTSISTELEATIDNLAPSNDPDQDPNHEQTVKLRDIHARIMTITNGLGEPPQN